MSDDAEKIAHLHRVIDFERKQYADERRRMHLRMDQLEKLAHKNHAIRLVEILEKLNWEGGQSKLTKAQAKGAEAVVKLLRRLADAELDETAAQKPVGK